MATVIAFPLERGRAVKRIGKIQCCIGCGEGVEKAEVHEIELPGMNKESRIAGLCEDCFISTPTWVWKAE